MNCCPSLRILLLVAIALLSTTSPAHSLVTFSTVDASESGSYDPGQLCSRTSGAVTTASFAMCGVADSGGTGLTNTVVTASAQTGAVELVAVASATTSEYGWASGSTISYTTGGGAAAQFSDSFTIESPGRTNTLGYVTATFKLAGVHGISLSGGVGSPINDNDSYANVNVATQVRLGLASQIDHVTESGTIEPDSHTLDGEVPATITLTTSFLFGTPIDVSAKISAGVSSSARRVIFDTTSQVWVDSLATAGAEYGSSLVWGGISTITDANGVPIAHWTALSSTGTDYAVAAPEPDAATMVVAGVLLLASMRPRREPHHGSTSEGQGSTVADGRFKRPFSDRR
ncbi:MAG: hypothetical protein U0900_06055 [Myxococcota bacterium]